MSFIDNVLYGDSVQYAAVSAWVTAHAYSVGNIVRQAATPTVGQERCFICIVAGTSGGAEPTWVITRGAKNAADGTVTWQECTGLSAVNGDNTSTPNWNAAKSGSLSLGVLIKDIAGTHYFICTTAGTAGSGSEPAWNTTAGVTTADNTVTWTCLGLASAFTGIWKAPGARLGTMVTNTWLSNAGMKIFVGDDHAETAATAFASTLANTCFILCVDHTASVPPGSANLKTTASITDTSTGTFNVFGISGGASGVAFYCYGVQFIKGATGQYFLNNAGNSSSKGRFEQCLFSMSVTSSNFMTIGYQFTAPPPIEFVGCTFNFVSTTQAILLGGAPLTFKNCTMTGSSPNAGMQGASNNQTQALVLFEGCDFSAWTNNLLGGSSMLSNVVFKDCKLNASVAVYSGGAANIQEHCGLIELVRADSGGTNYRSERWTAFAGETTSIVVVRTGGASDGTTPVSHQVATTINDTTANLAPITAYHSAIPLAIWNSVTGTNRAITIYGIVNDSRVPNNDEVWTDVEYLGSASSPQGSFASNFKANVLASGAALTADTSAWDSAATARQNTHSYAVGNVISVSSAPGQLFFCTAGGGNSASSLPGGYATCADGASVTDGGFTFRAACRFKIVVTLSGTQPAQAGYLYVYPKFARASFTYFLDPEIYLS